MIWTIFSAYQTGGESNAFGKGKERKKNLTMGLGFWWGFGCGCIEFYSKEQALGKLNGRFVMVACSFSGYMQTISSGASDQFLPARVFLFRCIKLNLFGHYLGSWSYGRDP